MLSQKRRVFVNFYPMLFVSVVTSVMLVMTAILIMPTVMELLFISGVITALAACTLFAWFHDKKQFSVLRYMA